MSEIKKRGPKKFFPILCEIAGVKMVIESTSDIPLQTDIRILEVNYIPEWKRI